MDFRNTEKEETLTDYQKEILSVIVDKSIENISYRNPGKNLGEIVEGKSYEETLDALGSLEKEFDVLKLIPSRFLFFNLSFYKSNLNKVKQLYGSYNISFLLR